MYDKDGGYALCEDYLRLWLELDITKRWVWMGVNLVRKFRMKSLEVRRETVVMIMKTDCVYGESEL